MKIYLLSIDRRRFFFYADESEPPDDRTEGDALAGGAAGRPGGWFSGRRHRIQSAWEHSDARAVQWSRRAWDWMHSWAHPDESMLSRFRSARRIELYHPAARDAGEVRKLWGEYLNHRWWRHILWMSANGLVAPLLWRRWLLPGPNVIGYWFAYRAIHHALILRGIYRVRRGRVEVVLRPMDELDRPIERDEGGKARHAASTAGLLSWTSMWPGPRAITRRGRGARESLRDRDRGDVKIPDHENHQLQYPQGDRRPRPSLPARADCPRHRRPRPDMVCLQEVDRNVGAVAPHDQPRELSDALRAAEHLYQLNVRVKHGGYGNLVLSRWPFRCATRSRCVASVASREVHSLRSSRRPRGRSTWCTGTSAWPSASGTGRCGTCWGTPSSASRSACPR